MGHAAGHAARVLRHVPAPGDPRGCDRDPRHRHRHRARRRHDREHRRRGLERRRAAPGRRPRRRAGHRRRVPGRPLRPDHLRRLGGSAHAAHHRYDRARLIARGAPPRGDEPVARQLDRHRQPAAHRHAVERGRGLTRPLAHGVLLRRRRADGDVAARAVRRQREAHGRRRRARLRHRRRRADEAHHRRRRRLVERVHRISGGERAVGDRRGEPRGDRRGSRRRVPAPHGGRRADTARRPVDHHQLRRVGFGRHRDRAVLDRRPRRRGAARGGAREGEHLVARLRLLRAPSASPRRKTPTDGGAA